MRATPTTRVPMDPSTAPSHYQGRRHGESDQRLPQGSARDHRADSVEACAEGAATGDQGKQSKATHQGGVGRLADHAALLTRT